VVLSLGVGGRTKILLLVVSILCLSDIDGVNFISDIEEVPEDFPGAELTDFSFDIATLSLVSSSFNNI
jgi:hypothetical protein